VASGEGRELIHRLLNDSHASAIIRVDRFTGLKINVRVLSRSAQNGMIRGKRPRPVGEDQIVIDHMADIVIRQLLNFGNLVGCPEPVKEMQERQPGLEGSGLRDKGEIHDLLNAVGGKEGKPCGARRHHVRLVAEDRQGLGRQRTRRHVENRRGQFPGNLVHIGKHQKKPLGSRKGRGQRPCLQGAVDRAGGPSLTLHLLDNRRCAPDILLTLGRPLIGLFPHGRRRRDRVDSNDFVGLIRDITGRVVPVYGDMLSFHNAPIILIDHFRNISSQTRLWGCMLHAICPLSINKTQPKPWQSSIIIFILKPTSSNFLGPLPGA
jgi:hypothetical protein